MSILVIAEHDNQKLKGSTLNTVAAASKLAGEVSILIAGSGIDAVVSESQTLNEISKIVTCDNNVYENFIAEDLSSLVVAISDGYTHILAPSTTFGKNLMPRVAALLDTSQVSDIVNVISEDTFLRPIYAGNAFATVKSNDKKKCVTIRPTSFDPAPSTGGSAEIVKSDPGDKFESSKFVKREEIKSDRPVSYTHLTLPTRS